MPIESGNINHSVNVITEKNNASKTFNYIYDKTGKL